MPPPTRRSARIPTATYRLQFNRAFTFRDAAGIVDYLRAAGISDCYASSYLRAVPGSPHGYDVADPTQLNPEIGTEAEYQAWIDAMRRLDMGHVLDVVPNHMGIAKSSNPRWNDVLENGPSSRYARFFDIEWHPVKDELADKVLLPILGDQYGAVLERQELRLDYRDGAFVVRHFEDVLPIAPDTFVDILEPELEPWLASQPAANADELQSILTSSRNLPPRSTRDPDLIALRAREKEVVKRRLAALVDTSAELKALVDAALRRYNGTLGNPRSFDALDRLLNAQSYRLAHWRVASEEINYRRFFDVNELAAVRMEDPVVFEEVHQFILDLVKRGAATGLRIDHVDGLYAPGDYLRRLQARAAEALDTSDECPLFLVVEKILGRDEDLPPDWPVDGTTGYEFAATVNNLFVDGRNEAALDAIYTRFIRERRERVSFDALAYRSKKQVVHVTMSSNVNLLGHQLNRFSEHNRHYRDFTLYSLISTLKGVIASFPVYRTYVTEADPVTERDRRYIADAVLSAKRRAPDVTPVVFDFIEGLLLKQTPIGSQQECDERAAFIGKFQQITSPVAAKGIEDTAMYVYNRLLSLNDVGADPTCFGREPAVVHAWLAERQRRWPAALSATSTHDSKRGEDARARLNVLSEIPGAWKAVVTKWRTVNRRHKTEVKGVAAPGANEEYLLYQTLVGTWPFDLNAEGEDQMAPFRDRIAAYMIKALREAKVHTSWLSPDEDYERAVARFIDAILDASRPNPFLQAFLPFHARVAEIGIYNSLAQLLLKTTAPGVPDFYQGTELWDLNLVDPDNRRPVDYDRRRQMLAGLEGLETMLRNGEDRTAADRSRDVGALLAGRTDGRIKLFVMTRALGVRARLGELYERGEYLPLHTSGARRECVFAFARRDGDAIAITAVPRLVGSLVPDAAAPPLGSAVWADTRIDLPADMPRRWTDTFTGATIDTDRNGDAPAMSVATLFDRFPVALLVPAGIPARSTLPAILKSSNPVILQSSNPAIS